MSILTCSCPGSDRPAILQHLDELRAGAEPPVGLIDLTDLSWSNRKAAASSQLSSAAAQDALVRIFDLDTIDTPASLQNHEPDLIAGARPGQEPDLKAQLTILVPNGSTPPSLGELPNRPLDEERERVALQVLNSSDHGLAYSRRRILASRRSRLAHLRCPGGYKHKRDAHGPTGPGRLRSEASATACHWRSATDWAGLGKDGCGSTSTHAHNRDRLLAHGAS